MSEEYPTCACDEQYMGPETHHPTKCKVRRKFDELYACIAELSYVEITNSQLCEALEWCGGSDDFALGGKAYKGWVKICKPLLDGSVHAELEAEFTHMTAENEQLWAVYAAACAWLEFLESQGGRFLDGIPGELMDAVERATPCIKREGINPLPWCSKSGEKTK